MTGTQIMVVLIVAMAMIASIIRKGHRGDRGRELRSAVPDPETVALRQEVKALKERLAVIERITVEKENSLERQIEQLRDK